MSFNVCQVLHALVLSALKQRKFGRKKKPTFLSLSLFCCAQSPVHCWTGSTGCSDRCHLSQEQAGPGEVGLASVSAPVVLSSLTADNQDGGCNFTGPAMACGPSLIRGWVLLSMSVKTVRGNSRGVVYGWEGINWQLAMPTDVFCLAHRVVFTN